MIDDPSLMLDRSLRDVSDLLELELNDRLRDAGVPLVSVCIDDKRCTYCLECTSVCPSGALRYDKCFEHDSDDCMNCEVCMDVCQNDAIKIVDM